ncbi:MAG TPA: cbb3-type cytochrome c oxidase N-terminal domain-containing protein [Thermodesulfovibrionales bacterium]|nr:cbb3-type cytochrome c oxidase N-terminal domain-containing protein [Thermodesulfovibrionales bacterium]
MAGHEELDELKEFLVEEGVDAKRKIPIGWLILFWGLILWGIYYFAAYSPSISGWTQQKAYEESLKK